MQKRTGYSLLTVFLISTVLSAGCKQLTRTGQEKTDTVKTSKSTSVTDPGKTTLKDDYKVIWQKMKPLSGMIFPERRVEDKDYEYYCRLFIASNAGTLKDPQTFGRVINVIRANSPNQELNPAQRFLLDRLDANLTIAFLCREKLTASEIDEIYAKFKQSGPDKLQENYAQNSITALLTIAENELACET